MTEQNKIRDAADAVRGLVKAVPIYEDLAQPTLQEVGHLSGRLVRAALAPLRGLVWGAEKAEEFLEASVARRLAQVPDDKIISPKLLVAGPITQALVFAGHEPELRELFAALLATAMNADTASDAHPAFVDMIRQMDPDEARLMKHLAPPSAPLPLLELRSRQSDGAQAGFSVLERRFGTISYDAGCERPDHLPEYLDNLGRLGLLEIPMGLSLTNPGAYETLRDHEHVRVWQARLAVLALTVELEHEMVRLTSLGVQFCDACGLTNITQADDQ